VQDNNKISGYRFEGKGEGKKEKGEGELRIEN
jgi:hypothetical protein